MKTKSTFKIIAFLFLSFPVIVIAKENVNKSGVVTSNSQYKELASNCAPATSQSDLDINNVRAKILGGGDMWWDLSSGSYFVPKPSVGQRGPSSMFAASLWIGGYDAGGVLKVAGQTYRQTGNDFWPGPLNFNGATDAATCSEWDKHFIVNRKDVEEFNAWYEGGPTNYTIPNSILTWPTTTAEGKPMAPFHDYDNDGVYNPINGDYPDFDIKGTKGCSAQLYGDQAMFWVFNDKGNIHSETGGPAIGIEIKAQAFGFKTTDEINNMTFYKYTITNKSSFRLDSTFFGVWADSDVGAYNDDFVGCDVGLGLGYSYNGDLIDGPSGNGELIYGANPPAVGIDFFEGPFADPDGIDNLPGTVPASFVGYGDSIIDNERLGMCKFVYYNNDPSPVVGNPNGAAQVYQYLTGRWKNGQLMTYGGHGSTPGGVPCSYMFPGDSDPLGFGTGGIPQAPWDEFTSNNVPADRRFLQSAGPFTLQPGAVNTITKGVVWARATQGGNLASLALLKGADFKAQQLFNNCFKTLDGPTAPNLFVQELDKEIILYWSNPLNSNNTNETYTEDYDISSGADKPYTFQGYMIYQLKDAFVSETEIYNVDKARLVFQCDKKDGVGQIINYTNDLELTALVPQEMVKGEDKGIKHSFKVTEDKFATGNTTLVNHKTYYYAIIAYGYSPTQQPVNLNQLNDYKPFIAGRKQADGFFAHAAIPHIVTPEMTGTEQNSIYGSGPKIKRVEGQGNGGNILDFTDETVSRILNSSEHRVIDPVYNNGKGPINISVIDPLNVPKGNEFRLTLKAKYPTTGTFAYVPQDSSLWVLENLITGEKVLSNKTIKYADEQIINGQSTGITTNVIPKWGISVNVKFNLNPGPTFDSINTITGATINKFESKNAFLEATMTFADPTKRWLTGVEDKEGNTHLNWIRAGNVKPTPATPFDDYKGEDDQGEYEKVLNGIWAPYRLCASTTPPSAGQPIQYIGGPAWPNFINLNELKNLASVDVVFTNDKTKWTRCPVIELQEEAALAVGGAVKLNRRIAPSVDKNGKKAGDVGYNSAEGDLNGTQGMGWFPGYALNLETGERLNMAFGEDSWLANENGADMLWNPTSSVISSLGGMPLFGGKHYIYVFGHNADAKFPSTNTQIPNGLIDIPRYDEGAALNALFTAIDNVSGAASNQYKLQIYSDAMWVNIPLLANGHKLLETDVKVRLRVAKQYKRAYTSTVSTVVNSNSLPPDVSASPMNNDYPVYEFNTNDIATNLNDIGVAKNAMELINVVPNPYYAYSAYEQKTLENIVKITNLPEKCKISIYTLNGNLVRTFKKDEPKTSIDWDLKNNKRIPIASGLYIIHVDADELGEKTLKWFGVIRPMDLESF